MDGGGLYGVNDLNERLKSGFELQAVGCIQKKQEWFYRLSLSN
ncbi:hypothetical protein QWZ13_10040 [Reinekea marina]|nr:hypothetical protein [Reinekea marina]MDN3649252.1 hypothetical protein [Reinekea marina]